MPVCPMCQSTHLKKNGFIATGKQRYCCCTCGRQFVENPENKIIPEHTWILVDKLLLERVPIAGISRVTGISEPWLQKYINQKYDNLDSEYQKLSSQVDKNNVINKNTVTNDPRSISLNNTVHDEAIVSKVKQDVIKHNKSMNDIFDQQENRREEFKKMVTSKVKSNQNLDIRFCNFTFIIF
mgnify:CR=1 FL=1